MNTAGTKTIETERLMGCSDMVTHEQYAINGTVKG